MPLMATPQRRECRGIGLVEMMVAMTIGLLVAGAAISIFATVSGTSNANLAAQRLNEELRATMAFISRELRRTGFWSRAALTRTGDDLTLSATSGTITITADTGTPFAPFGNATGLRLVGLRGLAIITAQNSGSQLTGSTQTPFDHVQLRGGAWRLLNPFDSANNPSVPTPNCVLYRYDVDGNNQVDPAERFGIRYHATSASVERYTGGVYGCGNGTWQQLTSPDLVRITALTFTLNPTVLDLDAGGIGTSTITVRDLVVTLSGELAGDPSVRRTMVETIRLRNDHYQP